jgi:hypothetical protein
MPAQVTGTTRAMIASGRPMKTPSVVLHGAAIACLLACEAMRRLSMARSLSRTAVVLAALLLGSVGLAQRIVVSPQAIVVNPLPAFDVDVWVDRDPSGRDAPSYGVGEEIQIGVRVSEDAFVYLFSVSAAGEIVQIVPNRYDAAGRDNFVRAGSTRLFPPQGARYSFVIDPPQGLAKVIAVASKRELDTRTLASFASERDFTASSRLGEDGFARALSIVVEPLPQESWVTATALYYVGSRPAVGAFGSLSVSSSPSRAEVWVDGGFAGFTPLSYGLRPGRYEVEVRLSGFVTHRETVQVRPDRTVNLSVPLAAEHTLARPGTGFLNAYLGLLPYPGSDVTRVRDGGRDSSATFTASARLRDVYEYFHEQLVRDGWRRTDLDVDDDEIEAEYRRGRDSFELELELEGRNRFELEIDFD